MTINFKDYIKQNRWIATILVVSFILSIFYSFYYQIKPQVDARAYDVIAQNIANGVGYREDINVDITYDYAISRVGPLYEYFLAGIYKVFGHSYPMVWIFQAILHTVSAYLIYLICLLVFAELAPRSLCDFAGSENKQCAIPTHAEQSGKNIGLWAAAIFGFYPDLIEISAMLMTETLYLFFTCLMIFLFLLYIKNNNLKILLLMSFVSGVAVLVRPPLILFLPILFFYLYKKRDWGRSLLMIFILILVFLPWTMRNYMVYGEIMPFGTAGALNFWIGNHVGANGEQEAGGVIGSFISKNSAVDINKESIKQFKSFVNNYPVEFIKLTFLRMNKYFSILRPMGFWFYTSGWRQILFVFCSAIFNFLVFIFGLVGMWRAVKLKSQQVNYLLAFVIATPLLLFITVVETRYRFQIYPFLAIFAAYFIELIKENKGMYFRALLVSFGIITINGLIDGFINFNQFKDKIFSHFG